jgi:hypothetical protein
VVNALELDPLYSALLANASFHELLLAFDRDLADTARGEGCTLCGSRVHSAAYQRKPRGRPFEAGARAQRFSFCCAITPRGGVALLRSTVWRVSSLR